VKDIVVIGGGGHGKVVISLIRKLATFRLLGYTDTAARQPVLGVPCLGGDEVLHALESAGKPFCAALGLGNVAISGRRLDMARGLLARGIELPPLVSPAAVVNEDVEVGPGAVVCDGAVIAAGARIGTACIINTGCVIDHDCRIGDGVHVAPGAVLCGDVAIGELAMVGAGAVVIQGRRVGARCLVAAGATVARDADVPGVYAGTPARMIRGSSA
jgi:UDP-perosamine 4-acetyltransferase